MLGQGDFGAYQLVKEGGRLCKKDSDMVADGMKVKSKGVPQLVNI